jgi:ferredoxin
MKRIKIHPLSAKGKYYVDVDVCLWSAACEDCASPFFAVDDYNGAYLTKQPESKDDHALVQKAINTCPVIAICDDGDKLPDEAFDREPLESNSVTDRK